MFYIVKNKKIKSMSFNKKALESILNKSETIVELDLNGIPTDLVTVEKDGTFAVETIEPSAAEIKKAKIAEIKAKYEEKFKLDESALVRARLAGNDKAIETLQARYKTNMLAMTKEIKEA